MEKYNTSFEILEEYIEEGISLRGSVLKRMEETNPEIYHIACSKAKNVILKEWDEENNQMKFVPTDEKKESSKFFFVWTQIEREIREAMKTCFSNPSVVIDCHDAVYSTEIVSNSTLEEAVNNITGFKVKVSQ